MDFDTLVKLNIYETVATTGQLPSSKEVARATGAASQEVEAAFERLHKKRLLVPEPGDPAHIRMAPPFSGIPTNFQVQVKDQTYYANCVWDALGIPAALHQDGIVLSSDAFTGESMTLEIKDAKPVEQACLIHFAVPAARWWEDIVYT